VKELFEVLDIRTETARQDEHFSIEETVRAVFGDSVEIVEFIPYGEED
jgi:hypothetical protein